MPFFSTMSLLLESACVLGLRKKLTEDGENDHEEEEKQEDVHEGRQGLKHLTQVAGGRQGQEGEGQRVAGWGPGAWSGTAQCRMPC